MKKVILLLFVVLFSLSFVFAANGWGDTNVGGDSDDDVAAEEEAQFDAEQARLDDDKQLSFSEAESSSGGERYNQNFYIALGIAIVGILIAAFFVYLFLRSPKNRWKKANSKIVKS